LATSSEVAIFVE